MEMRTTVEVICMIRDHARPLRSLVPIVAPVARQDWNYVRSWVPAEQGRRRRLSIDVPVADCVELPHDRAPR